MAEPAEGVNEVGIGIDDESKVSSNGSADDFLVFRVVDVRIKAFEMAEGGGAEAKHGTKASRGV